MCMQLSEMVGYHLEAFRVAVSIYPWYLSTVRLGWCMHLAALTLVGR